ncbi:AraC family transcriptional regulator [uncultured Sphaerochaeta sp.]|uniref:AraC family transcriptional regulator n=1 Tax=uncultured Sphaerochaeta sp. TaxID=886478 RepID=UPI002A0A7795|nr:AraC family transcriptional regulator [uncultured Sphaerochaeta sp.]
MKAQKEIVHASPGCKERYLTAPLLAKAPYASAKIIEGAYCLLDSQFWIQRIANRGFHVLVLCLSGCGEFIMEDGTTFLLEPGKAFLSCATGQAHFEKTHGPDIWESIWMNFDQSSPWFIPAIDDWKVYELSQQNTIKDFFLSAILEDHYFDQDSPKAQELYCQLFLITLKRGLEWSEEHHFVRYRKQFSLLWQKVSTNLSRNWGIDELCKEMHLSRAHLTRLCLKLYQTSPAARVRTIKMDQAKVLIENTDLVFSEVAEMIGFSTPAALSTAFKHHFGVSPRELRKEKQQ